MSNKQKKTNSFKLAILLLSGGAVGVGAVAAYKTDAIAKIMGQETNGYTAEGHESNGVKAQGHESNG